MVDINGNLQCPRCNSLDIIGIEYSPNHPNHYDGISEWVCNDCGYREGRFSGKELLEDECEDKYGE